MSLRYKIDVVKALADVGYYPRKIRTERLLSESTLTKLRAGVGVSWSNIETLCRLLQCQPGDLIEYVPDTHDAHDARE